MDFFHLCILIIMAEHVTPHMPARCEGLKVQPSSQMLYGLQ